MHTFVERGGGWVAVQVILFLAWGVVVTQRSGLPGWLRGAGLALAVAGAVLAMAGLTGLGRNLTPYPEPVAGGALVEHGVYGIVRHPIYGGVALGAMGAGLAFGSLGSSGVGVVLLVFFGVKARREERRLEASYPAYADYRRRVRAMLVPWLV